LLAFRERINPAPLSDGGINVRLAEVVACV